MIVYSTPNQKDIIRLLKKGVDINMLNEHGQNALFHCHSPEAM